MKQRTIMGMGLQNVYLSYNQPLAASLRALYHMLCIMHNMV